MARRARTAAEPETAGTFAPEATTQPGAKVFAEIAEKTKGIFRPAREVLRRVRAVPSVFPWIDWKVRVGGWPIERLTTIHGPSGFGKTLFANGIGYSCLKRGHMYALVDAEQTTPISWLEMLFSEYADSERFVAARPENYEQAVDGVNFLAREVARKRELKEIPEWMTCFFVIDSLGKLVPKNLQSAILKYAADSQQGSVDGMKGAAGMIRAALNKAWVDQLVPLMASTGCGLAFIIREAEDRNASADDKRWGNDWKMTGGRHVFFDSSLDVRVSRADVLHEKERGTDGWRDSPVVGERHRVDIHKTKVSARQDEIETAFFHTSSGLWTPEGFDRGRDLLELGVELEIIDKKNSWLSFGGKRFNGTRNFLTKAEPAYLDKLEAAVRATFARDLEKTKAEVVGG